MTTKLIKAAQYEVKEVTYTDKVQISEDVYETRCDYCDAVIEDRETAFMGWLNGGRYGMRELDYCTPTCAGRDLAKWKAEHDDDFRFAFQDGCPISQFDEYIKAYLEGV